MSTDQVYDAMRWWVVGWAWLCPPLTAYILWHWRREYTATRRLLMAALATYAIGAGVAAHDALEQDLGPATRVLWLTIASLWTIGAFTLIFRRGPNR